MTMLESRILCDRTHNKLVKNVIAGIYALSSCQPDERVYFQRQIELEHNYLRETVYMVRNNFQNTKFYIHGSQDDINTCKSMLSGYHVSQIPLLVFGDGTIELLPMVDHIYNASDVLVEYKSGMVIHYKKPVSLDIYGYVRTCEEKMIQYENTTKKMEEAQACVDGYSAVRECIGLEIKELRKEISRILSNVDIKTGEQINKL